MSRRHIRLLASLTILGAVLMFISCSSSSNPTSSNGGGNPMPGPNAVSIVNFAFSPSNLPIKTGTKVTWTNNGSVSHTVTSDNGAFTSSGSISPGSIYEVTFSSAGTFHYHCSIHPSMTGTITVTN
jgi:plastocyanin